MLLTVAKTTTYSVCNIMRSVIQRKAILTTRKWRPLQMRVCMVRLPFPDWLADWLAYWANWLTDLMGWLTDGWVTDWLIDWLTNWRTDSLTDWFDWLTAWRTAGLSDGVADWRTDGLADGVTDWLTDWLTDWQTEGLTDDQNVFQSCELSYHWFCFFFYDRRWRVVTQCRVWIWKLL